MQENHELLSRLDAATGDGDHGVTMKRVAEAIIESVAGGQSLGVGPLLEQVGWNVMSVDGGSTSPLLGSFFMGMAEAVGGSQSLDGPGLAAAFEAGLAKLRAQTPAQPGDKTMVDALVPAVEALRQAADAGAEPAVAAGPGSRRRPARRETRPASYKPVSAVPGTSARGRSATSIPAPPASHSCSRASATG